jgi:SAM-dependent methyltransferase
MGVIQVSARQPVALTHRFFAPWRVLPQLARGKSLSRTLLNLSLRSRSIGGQVLDLGAKSRTGSYYSHLSVRDGAQITFTDLAGGPGIERVDVEQAFPFDSASFDVVLAMHLFEHVYHYRNAPAEIARILKPGGELIVAVPFLQEYHADPDDYVRLTQTALVRWGEDAGLRCTYLEALGEGLLTFALTKFVYQALPAILRPVFACLAYLVATPFDRLVALRPRVKELSVPQRFALEFVAVFIKDPRP